MGSFCQNYASGIFMKQHIIRAGLETLYFSGAHLALSGPLAGVGSDCRHLRTFCGRSHSVQAKS
jgi:hypothetical protein